MKTKILLLLALTITTTFASCTTPTTPQEQTLKPVDMTLQQDTAIITKVIQPVAVNTTGLTINPEYIDNLMSKVSIDSLPDTDNDNTLEMNLPNITTDIDDTALKVKVNGYYFMTIKFFNNNDIKVSSIFNCNGKDYDLGSMEEFFLSETNGYSAYLVDMYSNDEYKQILQDEINENDNIDDFDWLLGLRYKILVDGQDFIILK